MVAATSRAPTLPSATRGRSGSSRRGWHEPGGRNRGGEHAGGSGAPAPDPAPSRSAWEKAAFHGDCSRSCMDGFAPVGRGATLRATGGRSMNHATKVAAWLSCAAVLACGGDKKGEEKPDFAKAFDNTSQIDSK